MMIETICHIPLQIVSALGTRYKVIGSGSGTKALLANAPSKLYHWVDTAGSYHHPLDFFSPSQLWKLPFTPPINTKNTHLTIADAGKQLLLLLLLLLLQRAVY